MRSARTCGFLGFGDEPFHSRKASELLGEKGALEGLTKSGLWWRKVDIWRRREYLLIFVDIDGRGTGYL